MNRGDPVMRGRAAIAPDTGLLCVLVLVGPQLFGGAFPWTIVVIAGLALTALGTSLWVRRYAPPRIVDGLFIAMGLAWVWTVLQIVPLPSGVADAMRLGSIESAERLQGLAWAGRIPLTISYDPGSTQLQILVGIIILASFLAARLGGPSTLKPIAVATVASALLLGLEGLAHLASGADAVFGIYTPRFTQPQLLTPLMNSNHLGGFCVLGALISAGLAAQRTGRWRHVWSATAVLCVMTIPWTFSRGALGSLLFGLVLLGGWLIRGMRPDRRGSAISLMLASAVGVVAFVGLEPIFRRFETQGLDKLAVAARGLQLLDGSAWWFGVGRGAFSSAFVSEAGSSGRYTHPENLFVQWTTEWGVAVAGVLLVVVVLAMWKRLRTSEDPLVAATGIAILALSLQNLVDFSLEMAGIVVVVATLLGALLPASNDTNSVHTVRVPAASLAVFAVVLAVLGPRVLDGDTQSISDRLTRAIEHDREDEFQTTLRRGLALHPGEPAFALLAGSYAGSKGHPDAARWISIVMDEAPGWAAPHAVAARWLLERGQLDQALLEIREAELRHPGSARDVLCHLLTRSPSIEHLQRAAPGAELEVRYLERAATCGQLSHELRAEIDAAILARDATRASAVLRQSRRLVSQKRPAEGMALLEGAVGEHPEDASLWVAIIRVHLSAGNVEAARTALKAASARELDSRSLTEARARIEAAEGRTDEMRATITRLRGRSRGQAHLVAASFVVEGDLEASLGNIDEAMEAYAAADIASPDGRALHRAAKLALESGRTTQALRIYRTLCRRQPDGPSCAREAQLSEEVRERSVEPPMP